MLNQIQVDPNELIDTTGVGPEELLVAGAIVVVALVLGAVARRLVRKAVSRLSNIRSDLAVFLGRLTGWLVVTVGIALALMVIGFQLGPVLLVVGVIFIVLFLSARTLLENFGAGVVLQTENPFHLGDLVEVAGDLGVVQAITGRTTVLHTYDGRTIRVPNSHMLGHQIINYSERGHLASEVAVGVEYGTDLDAVRTFMVETVGEVNGVLSAPEPEVQFETFGNSAIQFKVRFWHEPTQQARLSVTDAVGRTLDRSLRAGGYVIAFPQVVIWDSRGNADA